jgi:hypothetical protein
MNYFDLYSSYPDHTITAAWDSQVKEAGRTPWLIDSGGELFSHFASYYAELRALPRGARRALQRKLARSSELAAILPEYLQQGGRRLQHRMAWSLAGAALLLALSQGIATAATITVTTNNPNIAADGQCSLIEAIVNANNDAATHADCPAGSGADTIVLPANANVTLTNLFDFAGLPQINSPIIIQGNGATIARNGNAPDFQLVAVTNSGDLTLQNVTLSGGRTFDRGGGLINYGTLNIANSTISGNAANYGGGGVSNWGTAIISNSGISGNDSSNYFGGGVANYGTVTIKDTTISGNVAYVGGGISNSGIVTIENSTVSGNTADTGGGLRNFGTLTAINSIISDNSANSYGGGIANSITLTIENSIVSGNTADRGGGIFNSGSLTITNSTVSGNSANHGADVFNALAIGTTTLANGEAGASFTSDLMISGGVGPYIVSITSGKLPAGLSLGNDGIISGTVSPNARSERITVRITDSLNESVIGAFTITVIKAVRIAEKAKTGRLGRDYRASFKTKGGQGPFSWSITFGALPPGLNFNTTTGAITGIPTQAGEFPLTVQVTDALGGVDVENLTLRIK